MSMLSAYFFNLVQSAAFYRNLHRQAILLLPPGLGARWVDIGCGPGLVTRLAADHGYEATGFDIDPAMIKQARLQAKRINSPAHFEEAGLDKLVERRIKVDVVSAASLLAVLHGREDVTQCLLACVKDDGVLLIIETTEAMKPKAAQQWLKKNGYGKRNWILLLWAWARSKGQAISKSQLDVPGYRVERVDLLEGLVAAWFIRRRNGPTLVASSDGGGK